MKIILICVRIYLILCEYSSHILMLNSYFTSIVEVIIFTNNNNNNRLKLDYKYDIKLNNDSEPKIWIRVVFGYFIDMDCVSSLFYIILKVARFFPFL